MTNSEIFMQRFGQAIQSDKQAEAGFDEIAQGLQNDGLQQGQAMANAQWQEATSPNNLNKIKSQNKQAILDGFSATQGQPQ